MLTRWICATLLLGVLAVASANVRTDNISLPQSDSKVVTSVDDALLESVLESLELDFDKDDSEMSSFTWTEDDDEYTLFQYVAEEAEEGAPATDMMLQVIIETEEVDEQFCMDWNTQSRFGRTYYMDGALYVEFDLDVEGGVTVGAIKRYIDRFGDTVANVKTMMEEGFGEGGVR